MSAAVQWDGRRDIDIERLLIWVYRRQKADLIIRMGAGLYRAEAEADGVEWQGGSACATAARIGEMGARVDGGGLTSGKLHEDAETVHQVVTATFSKPLALLVIQHARIGDRPDWIENARIKPERVPNARGGVRVFYDAWDKARNYGFCPISWAHSAARIESARQVYTLWRDALDVLQREFGGTRLLDHRATPCAAPRMPWLAVCV